MCYDSLDGNTRTSFLCHKISAKGFETIKLQVGAKDHHCVSAEHHRRSSAGSQCVDQPTMERLGLVLLLAQLAALATHANAGTAVLPLYRSKSSLDPNAQRSSHNVVCELHLHHDASDDLLPQSARAQ